MTEEPAPRAPHAPHATHTPAPSRGEGPGPDRPPQGHTAPHPPSGCRWCGVDLRAHFQRWTDAVGWHGWTPPTDAQTKARMLARRADRITARSTPRPPVRWNVCPDCLGRHEGGAACHDEPLADWERELLKRKADLDLPALNAAITDALAHWHEPGVHPDPAGMLAAVREAIDPTLFGLRDRATEEHDRAVLAEAALRDHGAKLAAEMRYGQQQYDRAEAAETERAALADRNHDLDAQLTRERQQRLAAEAAIRRVLPALDSAHSALVTSPRDQGAARDTAWLYGIFVGWDPEKPGESEGAMAELAARHRWHPEDVERQRELRNAVSALRAALDADQPKETP